MKYLILVCILTGEERKKAMKEINFQIEILDAV